MAGCAHIGAGLSPPRYGHAEPAAAEDDVIAALFLDTMALPMPIFV